MICLAIATGGLDDREEVELGAHVIASMGYLESPDTNVAQATHIGRVFHPLLAKSILAFFFANGMHQTVK